VRGNNCFFWDGVRDVVLMFSQGGGYTGAYSVTSAANLYTRHGVTTFMPAPGTTQTTTGVLGPRLRLIFDNNSPFAATTSGNGTGDFTMALGALAPGIVEGYTLLSSTTTGAGCGSAVRDLPGLAHLLVFVEHTGRIRRSAALDREPVHSGHLARGTVPTSRRNTVVPRGTALGRGRSRLRPELQPDPDELRVPHQLVT
jgi:hypothetical protein